jgi:hypothetical protein
MISLSTLAGVAVSSQMSCPIPDPDALAQSALQYLHSDIKLGKADLEDCLKVKCIPQENTHILIGYQVSSIYITPTKKVVVGRDLFTTTHDDCDVAEIPGHLSDWLMYEFWDITMVVRCVFVQPLLRSSLTPKLFFTASLW